MLEGGPRCSWSRLRWCDGGSLNVQGRHTSNRLRRSLEGPHPLCTHHVRIQTCMGTARHSKPTWTGLGTLPRRRRGDHVPATHVSDKVLWVSTSVNTHPASRQQLGMACRGPCQPPKDAVQPATATRTHSISTTESQGQQPLRGGGEGEGEGEEVGGGGTPRERGGGGGEWVGRGGGRGKEG